MLFKRLFNTRRGFTLVEVLVALTITGLIMGGISTGIIQLMSISERNTNAITAQRQLQQAGDAISTDVVQARRVLYGQGNTPAGTGFSIVLEWTNLVGNEFTITYRITNDGLLLRDESINGGTATTRKIAEHISTSAANTFFVPRSGFPGTYTLTITAIIEGRYTVTETRIYEVRQRSS
ncbi:MAG: prepilin-type N-terminal cleavage/methylation domain-containing protein [Dehalogenimonas sp.]|uniref:Prepilin-type N-terminal cleavage/methylation domain-containing protein n=1 Tax=Candidatus Dehalogenimonas loeffleri TaxID=3127115 RepID=A0ABZ2J863_9CHLR|nr:prepilin-type N-terminal cleavage/methylation domain-containing protein [Dehalogenimonas sp.]